MTNLYIEETWIAVDAKDRRIGLGNSDVYESSTNSKSELYRSLVKVYGRCVSKVYIDKSDGKPQAIGWVFVKRAKYEDTKETYLAETWITVHEKPPTKTVENHYVNIG